MDEDDDFDFSDPDLDDLPANALHQLETTALLSTQHPVQSLAAGPDSDYGDDEGDTVINLDDETEAPQALPVAPPRYAPQQYPARQQHGNNNGYAGSMELEPPRKSQADPDSLLGRIKKLEQEKHRLNRELQDEKTRNLSKTGEVDTVRRRFDAATKENDRRMLALQQSHNEQLTKQKQELDKIRREREQAQTEHLFMGHDLSRDALHPKQPARRPGTRAGAIATRPKPTVSPSGTPRRGQKNLPLRDGFEDDDVIMASPSKKKDKAGVPAATPKQASKRKRLVGNDSPIQALQLSEPRERPQLPQEVSLAESLAESEGTAEPSIPTNFGLEREDKRFILLHRLINKKSPNRKDRLLEALSTFSFPSQPDKKLSSIVYDILSSCANEPSAYALAARIGFTFLGIWEQCLIESYYAPLKLVVDAFAWVLSCSSFATAIAVTERAIPIIINTIELVSEPVTRLAKSKQLFAVDFKHVFNAIDIPECLELLYTLATSCINKPKVLAKFWRQVGLEFVVRLLHRYQPISYIQLMLRILGTSALKETLGPITPSDPEDPLHLKQQQQMEDSLIERLTWLLKETPEPLPDPNDAKMKAPPYSPKQLLDLRLQVLALLTRFSIHPKGSERLMTHRFCIARLIVFLDSSITALYASPLHPTTQDLTISAINTTMRLIAHLAQRHPEINLQSKMGVVSGGGHKYLVALTRLAFSDALVLERGVEEDVVVAAHGILDAGLSLEEGEGLVRVFSSGGSG
ncbi:hypothetical protein BDV96DRAFT_651548 [Lophiotrema nucula]|uniref:DNA repair protein Rad26 n=1 Tax=Lophiotrema nucula TaxID=690887 RepID=A0A6A5YS76_9PLEO|nr:hypothetical protein BDV96DRAFT_651548 [Lophiotrema nucula]